MQIVVRIMPEDGACESCSKPTDQFIPLFGEYLCHDCLMEFVKFLTYRLNKAETAINN